ncbi:MAG: DUF99 family protein [Thermoplasmata archaeon]
MKSQIRTLGIDDAPFKFTDKTTEVVAVLLRGNFYMDAVLKTKVEVDGRDATDKLIEMIKASRYKEQIKTIMIDGIAFGGFNVIDIQKLYGDLNIPVITITRKKPDLNSMKKVLKQKFTDWNRRWNVIISKEIVQIKRGRSNLYVNYVGLKLSEVKEVMDITTLRGVMPEPIRIAHLIAAGIKIGESHGRA